MFCVLSIQRVFFKHLRLILCLRLVLSNGRSDEFFTASVFHIADMCPFHSVLDSADVFIPFALPLSYYCYQSRHLHSICPPSIVLLLSISTSSFHLPSLYRIIVINLDVFIPFALPLSYYCYQSRRLHSICPPSIVLLLSISTSSFHLPSLYRIIVINLDVFIPFALPLSYYCYQSRRLHSICPPSIVLLLSISASSLLPQPSFSSFWRNYDSISILYH